MVLAAMIAVSPGPVEAGILEKLFAPRARLWDFWERHDKDSQDTIDHGRWASFLGAYVRADASGINLVDYGSVSAEDRKSLSTYIDSLQTEKISGYSRPVQFAYWVNLYNALTIRIVLDHYPVESIRKIKLSPGLFSKGPWSEKLLEIEGEKVSLNDIEHRILRPIWRDPRIHYAVNCASVGCPDLMPVPYTEANAQQLLDQGAVAYVNHPRGVRIENGRLFLSSLYVWFESDFGGDEAGIIEHIGQYAEKELADHLEGITEISGDDYDWALNDSR